MRTDPTDYDSPWKEALERYFPDFMAFCFPQAYADIDWVMGLPEELEEGFWEELQEYEEEKKMAYITSVERIGIEQGMEQGRLRAKREDVLEVLKIRFQEVPESIEVRINRIEDAAALDHLLEQAVTTGSLEEFEQARNL